MFPKKNPPSFFTKNNAEMHKASWRYLYKCDQKVHFQGKKTEKVRL